MVKAPEKEVDYFIGVGFYVACCADFSFPDKLYTS